MLKRVSTGFPILLTLVSLGFIEPSAAASPAIVQGAELRVFMDAKTAFEEGHYADAKDLFSQFLGRYPKSDLAGSAKYNVATCYLLTKDYQKALQAYERCQKEAPGYLPDSVMQGMAATYRELLDFERAQKIYDELLSRLPDTKIKDAVHYGKARCFDAQGKFAEAMVEYQVVLDSFPASPFAPSARLFLNGLKHTQETK